MKIYKGFLSLITCILLLQISPLQAGAQSASQQGSNGYAIAAAIGGSALAVASTYFLWKSSSSCARTIRRWFRRTIGIKGLHQAAAGGDVERIRMLIEDGEDVNVSVRGTTPLHLAAGNDHAEVVQMLLDGGACIDAADNDGQTPLVMAAGNGYMEIITKLSQAGAKFHDALHWVAQNGNIEAVRALLNAFRTFGGAVLHRIAGEESALHRAAKNGSVGVVQRLLDAGLGVDTKSYFRLNDGYSHYGSYYGTPLLSAATNGHAAVIRVLLEAGASVDECASRGGTALHLAAKNGHVVAVRMLIEAGSCIDDVRPGASPLGQALGHAGVVQMLAEAGADLSAFDLHQAALHGHADTVREMVKRGAVWIPGVRGHRLFHRDERGVQLSRECDILSKNRLKAINTFLGALPDAVADTCVAPFVLLTSAQGVQLKRVRADERHARG